MKHVFVINSHTTCLTMLGTIEMLNLPKQDIIIYTVRNYNSTLLDSYSSINADKPYTQSGKEIFCGKHRDRRGENFCECIKDVDEFVSITVNDKYHLFAPHLAHPFFQLLYTNSDCLDMSYLQETGIVYNKTFKHKLAPLEWCKATFRKFLFLRTNRVWLPQCWYLKTKMKKQKDVHSYALDDKIFRNMDSINHIIKWPTIEYKADIYTESCFFIFDGFVKNGIIERSIYLEKCEKLISEENKSVNYLKFHPNQTEEEKDNIVNIFRKKKLSYTIMNNDIPFELYLMNYNNLTLAGFGSSLLFFSKSLGNNVICRDRWLMESLKYQSYKKSFDFSFFDEVYD